MAFTDYKTLAQVKASYPELSIRNQMFLPSLSPLEVPADLEEEILFNLKTYKNNEFFAAEGLVTPILRRAWRKFHLRLNYWSHQAIKYDEDLSGVPDYLFTHLENQEYEIFSYPILTTVEAKADNFTEGWAQCAVQMLACQKLNPEHHTIFGIVTTGKLWEFAQMTHRTIDKHPIAYGLDYLGKLMAILDYLLTKSAEQLHDQ